MLGSYESGMAKAHVSRTRTKKTAQIHENIFRRCEVRQMRYLKLALVEVVGFIAISATAQTYTAIPLLPPAGYEPRTGLINCG